MIARPLRPDRAEETSAVLSPSEFPVDVVGIIISQLINVHIIISEDAGNEEREKGGGVVR